jgi:hypothetical protein
MIRSDLAAAFFASLSLCSNVVYAADELQNTLPAADNETVERLIAPVFSNLKAGDSAATVDEFLGISPMFDGKKQEMQYLVSQIDSTMSIYGKISDCALASIKTRANIAQSRQYLCQHEKFITRWVVIVAKTSKGWGPVSLSFDDQMMNEN